MSNSQPIFTIPQFLATTVANCGEEPAILLPNESGEVHTLTWDEVARDVCIVSDFFVERGIAAGDRVGHVSANRYAWIVTDLAMHLLGAVHVPIHATLSGSQIAALLQHAGVRALVVENETLDAAIAQHLHSIPDTFLYDANDPTSLSATRVQFPKIGIECPVENRTLDHAPIVEAAVRCLPEDLATILYTSGTSGVPKGVMLSQQNLASNALRGLEALGAHAGKRRLNFLPLSHIFARTCDLYSWVYAGSTMGLARNRETIVADCQAVKPHTMSGVPYFFQKLHARLCEAGVAENPGILKGILGGEMLQCICGGAPLPIPIAEYFERQGLPLLPGYGLTETSPVVTATPLGRIRIGTVGLPIADVRVRIETDGEIVVQGPNVMQGYYRDPESTAQVMNEGWFRTGDLGLLDAEGYLTITGRKKEMLVLSTGKKVAPTAIESALTSSPFIEQALVCGEGEKCLAALLILSVAAIEKACAGQGIEVPPREDWEHHSPIRAMIEHEIAAQLRDYAAWEQLGSFTLLSEPFTIENDMLTAKHSLRREVIVDRYRDQIAAMFEKGPSACS